MAKKKYKVSEEGQPKKKKRTIKKAIKESKEEMMPEKEEMEDDMEDGSQDKAEVEMEMTGEDRLKRLAAVLKKLSGKKIKVKQ